MNHAITYESDQEHYGLADHWVGRPRDGRGDCEDYAISKFEVLEEAGFSVVTNARVRTVIVRDHGQYEGHALLEVRLPNGSIMELDNNFDEPMRRQELERTYGYTFFDW